jgi:ADP-ribosyl-[dinitrogen reductase] hydrolase
MNDSMDPEVLDRAVGVLLASACGDALGAGYEFLPPTSIRPPVGMIGGGSFAWEPGEWTDDTSMAWVIAQVAATGVDLRTEEAQDQITAGWFAWQQEAKDIGIQTHAALARAGHESGGTPTAAHLREAAARYHDREGRSGGNGSLMRTAPVALAYLDDSDGLTEAAMQISALTHFDPEAGEACVLQCQAIRHAVRTGELDLRVGLRHLDRPRAQLWHSRIDDAEGRTPQSFTRNGWGVEALMGAWSAIVGTAQHDVQGSLEAAVLGGHDTDTVAAIAGALVGAEHGATSVPRQWRAILHGWPGKTGDDLVELGLRIVAGGTVQ